MNIIHNFIMYPEIKAIYLRDLFYIILKFFVETTNKCENITSLLYLWWLQLGTHNIILICIISNINMHYLNIRLNWNIRYFRHVL